MSSHSSRTVVPEPVAKAFAEANSSPPYLAGAAVVLPFAEGYHLRRDAMVWYGDQYSTETRRGEIPASPLRATVEQVTGLPPALVITAEADVLGTIHDFVVIDVMAGCDAAKGTTAQAVQFLTNALTGDVPPTTDGRARPSGAR